MKWYESLKGLKDVSITGIDIVIQIHDYELDEVKSIMEEAGFMTKTIGSAGKWNLIAFSRLGRWKD